MTTTAPPTPEQIQTLKRMLLKKGAEVNDKLTRLLNGEQIAIGNLLGGGKSKPGESPIERLRRFMRIIDGALARVRDGSYGTCATCGDGLPVVHLEQIPWIDTCQACAKKAEEAGG